ncbi:sensor histidine kinase [Bacillus testis]|uniref:sensor histidine kinase n=1 Tax=Bacillus testis TaxID=1622072 RepID=UPI00067F365C|nr:HAMP domain-containing sensor histidine kinase [Bacillus testis]
MFQKTRIRLTIQNSMILILVIGAIAATVYFYMQILLYSDLDKDLEDLMAQCETTVKKGYIPVEATLTKPTFIQDPRVTVLLWDEEGKIIQYDDENTLFTKYQSDFKPGRPHRIEEKTAKGYYFRTISANFSTQYGDVTVQLVRNVNSEQEMIQRVGMVLTIGTLIGGIMAVIAGFYLAGVALVPITEAWNKQQQFVSDASHELRTPLAVVQSRADLLLRTPSATIEEKALEISVISKEIRRLTKLVNHLLLLARADSKAISINKTEFDLVHLLKEVLGNYIELAEVQGKKMELKTKEESLMMKGDEERIHQLIVILLDNALKFTEDGGEIIILCKKSSTGIDLSIADNGSGISKEDLPHIFDRFYQGEKSRTAGGGTGLGLSIAKWVVDQHNGKIKVNSEEGKGTIIKITFPK